MEAIYRILNRNYMRLSRHAFQTHPRGHSMFQDLDDLISQKENFIEYIKFEYSLAIFYNVVVSIPSFIYFYSRFSNIFSCDPISTIWIFVVSLIKILETFPKGVLIYQTVRISNNNNDPIICSRRLMYMTRSYIFFYNTILGYMLLISYTFYFLCIRRSNVCEKAPQFYFIINWLVFGFFLRLIISFVNYFLHFKYGVNEADIANSELCVDYSNKVSPEVLNMIESVTLNDKNIQELISFNHEDNERDGCCICMLPFEVKETIKLMPCNKKHIFHKACIDKWLSHNKACPTCRKEINKKLIQKNKIY
jgi:hypothetical protein